jgi:hypothetical protein
VVRQQAPGPWAAGWLVMQPQQLAGAKGERIYLISMYAEVDARFMRVTQGKPALACGDGSGSSECASTFVKSVYRK